LLKRTMSETKTALVTGANSGVGLELTKKLLSEGFDVIALTRSDFPVDEAIDNAVKANKLRRYRCDLSDFKALKTRLQEIKEREDKIDVLFNNAGISLEAYKYSPQDREMHYEVNAVVPYIIIRELEGLVLKGKFKSIVNVSSTTLSDVKKLVPSELAHPKEPFQALFGSYATSKLVLTLWTSAVAPEYSVKGIEVKSVCPGMNSTPLSGNSAAMPWWLGWTVRWFWLHPSVGAGREYNAALKPKLQGKPGAFIDVGKVTKFKFGEHKDAVLQEVKRIYEEEFLAL